MKKVLNFLKNYYLKEATQREKGVLAFIINNPHQILEMDIHSLADTCACSSATVSRICQRVGFSGYRQLKLAIAEELGFSQGLPHNYTNPGLNEKKMAEHVLYEDMKAIQGVYDLMDLEVLQKVTGLMEKATSICLFGIGASFLVMQDLAMKCIRIRKPVWLYEDLHLQYVVASNVEAGDLCFIASYSGQTQEMLEIARMVKTRGGIIVTITQYSSNKLASLADYNLYVPAIEEKLRCGASSSRISQLAVVDCLFHTFFLKKQQSNMERIQESGSILEKDQELSFSLDGKKSG